MIYGYARVGSIGQTLNAQLEQLQAAGCEKIYREKATAKHNDRRELQRMLKAMQRAIWLLSPGWTGSPAARAACSHAGRPCGQRRGVSLAARYRGRHDDHTWALDAQHSWRAGRVRARADSGAHDRGTHSGEAAGPAHGPTPCPH